MGAPGSGKDTQVKELQKSYNLELISSGDVARELGKKDPEIEAVLEKGGLIPDEKIVAELENRTKNVSKEHGFILDGFPRTLKQTSEIEKFLFRIGKKIDSVIYLFVSEEELVRRLSKRYFCPKCGYISRTEEKVCPKCGSKMDRRLDDKPSVVLNRVSVYMEKTIPVIEHYKSRGLLIEINGEQKIEEVTRDILAKLESES